MFPSSSNRGALQRQPLMTAHKVERLTALRRSEEQRVGDLLRYSNESHRLSNSAKNEAKVSQARKANFVAKVAAENLEQKRLMAEKENERMMEVVSQQNQQFATEISKRNTEREKLEREIQRICETSEELKELERNLKVAYVNKERAAQHQEALFLKKLENDREQAIEEKMEQDRQFIIKQEAEKDKSRRTRLVAQKEILQKQMEDKEKRMEKAKEEAMKDKAMVDSIMAKINEEDRRDIMERNRKRDETRSAITEFQEERERHKEILAQKEKEQEEEIKAYNEMMEERLLREESQKKLAEEEKKRRWQKIVEETKQQTDAKEEYDALRDMLWEEELEERRKKEEQDRIEIRLKQREDMMQQNKAQIIAQREMIAKMEEEEKRLVQLMLAKFAADEEDEKRKEQARQEAKEKFVSQAQAQRNERARLFQKEREKELEERSASAKQEEYRQRIIAEARRKLLAQHASQLQGFLPKGTAVDKKEAELLSQLSLR